MNIYSYDAAVGEVGGDLNQALRTYMECVYLMSFELRDS